MEQRKIISLGRSSLVISLPKHWIKLHELKQGDSVSVAVQRDRSLAIFPGSGIRKRDKKITLYIDPGEKAPSIARRIIACFLNGYFGIRLIPKKIFSIAQQKAIREISGKLYMRIMESKSKYIYVQTLIDETKASIDSGVRRMHAITVSMYRDVLNSLKNRDGALAKIVYSLDDDVDHFSFFVLRLILSAALDPTLADHLDLEPVDCLYYLTFVHRIEQVADRASNIAKNLIILDGMKERIPDFLLELIYKVGIEALNAYDRAVKAFFSKDVVEANKIIELKERIERLDRNITSQLFLSETENIIVSCLMCNIRDNIRETIEHATDISEITINRSYKVT